MAKKINKKKDKNQGDYRVFKISLNFSLINTFWFLLLIGILSYSLWGEDKLSPRKVSWMVVKPFVQTGKVDKIVVENKENANVYLNKEYLRTVKDDESADPELRNLPQNGYQFQYQIGSVDSFEEHINEASRISGKEVEIIYATSESWFKTFTDIMMFGFPIILFILIIRMFAKGGMGPGNSIMNVGRAKARMFDSSDVDKKVTFKDVAGLEEAKVEVMEIVDFLRKADKYKELGAKIPRGALLVGPPGTGKTLLAKAVAGEANVPFLSMSGSDFVEMFVGVGASRVRDLFEQAKQKAPCIVFIDEIDAIGRARGRNAGFSGNDERENTLNQLLTEMDGFQTNSGVIVLAATNRVDILDKALMRAGRFDRQIDVGLPELNDRKEIFEVHLRKLKLDPDLDREFLAKQTPGFSGADIANVCNEAALIAARNNKKFVSQEDFLAAVDRIIGGLEKKNKIITPEEKKTIAYHESGHATVSWLLENANPLIKVTIIPRGRALGAAWYLPEERQITTREQMMDELASLLAGRVSEKFFFGKYSTGALNDLERATKMAYSMVAYYGMSDKVGTLSYFDSTGQSDMAFQKPFSEKTAETIDQEVKALLNEAYELARKTIEENRAGLEALAQRLLEKEVVFTSDVEEIFGKRKKDILKEQQESENAAKEKANDVVEEVAPQTENTNDNE